MAWGSDRISDSGSPRPRAFQFVVDRSPGVGGYEDVRQRETQPAGVGLGRRGWAVLVWEYELMVGNDEGVVLRSVAPVFSTTDVARWLEHYRALGFEVEAHDQEYGFASLGPVELHASRNPDHDPRSTAGCAYLGVEDADSVWRQWMAVPGGRNVEPVDTDYGLREGGHIDPDGNLLRYGSWLTAG